MTALEELVARYEAGELMTDLETLVLSYGGETEAQQLAELFEEVKASGKVGHMTEEVG